MKVQTEEQKKKKRKKAFKIVGALMGVLLLIGCCGSASLITPSLPDSSDHTARSQGTRLVPTSAARLTKTPQPTYTPMPVETTTPTLTPRPTWTPRPTYTPQATNERMTAQVVEVVDGDTIKVDLEGEVYSVRYIGIDTPETVHPSKPVEWMGPEATEANQMLVKGQIVYLEKDVSETDRYGRLLRYVYVEDTFVNAELVRLGYAQVSTYPPDVRYQDLFLEMQQEAREAERGLWRPTPTALPPTALPVATATSVPAATAAPTALPVQPTSSPSWWMCPNSTAGASYVGSARSDKYHKLNCHWAAKISAANRICFANRQAALDKGYQACKVCKP